MRILHTLLDGFNEMTISEWAFGVFNVSVTCALTALNTAERSCTRDRTYGLVVSLSVKYHC